MEELEKAIEKAVKATETALYRDLLKNGTIGNAVIFANPKHKGLLEKVLSDVGIKGTPILYTSYIEEDKLLFSTDKYMVENAKKAMGMEEV